MIVLPDFPGGGDSVGAAERLGVGVSRIDGNDFVGKAEAIQRGKHRIHAPPYFGEPGGSILGGYARWNA